MHTTAVASTLRLAIVGSGPSGFYAAARVLGAFDPARGSGAGGVAVHMFEQLPAPFGLVRYGVAPDHPEVRNAENRFDQVARDPRFRFFGNVCVADEPRAAPHISLATLSQHYTHLLLAYGASEPRTLDIPGARLGHSLAALDFVEWYNGHPRAFAPGGIAESLARVRGERMRHVTVIGAGNVALDVARVLLRATKHAPAGALAHTDMPQPVLDTLRTWHVEHVSVCARRGPAQAAFTNKELREMLALHAPMRPLAPALLADAQRALPADAGQRRALARLLAQLEKGSTAATWTPQARPQWALEFLRAPAAFLGNGGGVSGVRWDVTRLDGARAVPTGAQIETPADMVVASVGYKSEPLRGARIPFDPRRRVVPNTHGRVDGCPGVYASGWVATGPVGIIATTMMGAFGVADEIVADWRHGQPTLCGGAPDDALARGLDSPGVISYADWLEIDAAERRRGAQLGKPREKFLHVDDMLRVLRRI